MINIEKAIRKFLRDADLMDDDFMKICLHDHMNCIQAMIQHVLSSKNIKIVKVELQKIYQGFNRSLIIDIFAEDEDGTIYDVEIQRLNSGATPRRARFHGGMMDVHHLGKGHDFADLPDSYVIFITENDVIGHGKTMYTISKYVDGFNEPFNDGQHIIYVNCSADNDGSEVWKLIHDMTCKNPDEMLIPELAERVSELKETPKGEREVNKYFKEFVKEAMEKGLAEGKAEGKAEGRAEGKAEAQENFVSTLIKAGVMTLEKIAETFSIPLSDVQAIAGRINNNA